MVVAREVDGVSPHLCHLPGGGPRCSAILLSAKMACVQAPAVENLCRRPVGVSKGLYSLFTAALLLLLLKPAPSKLVQLMLPDAGDDAGCKVVEVVVATLPREVPRITTSACWESASSGDWDCHRILSLPLPLPLPPCLARW